MSRRAAGPVVILGGHGRIARAVTLLLTAEGRTVRSIIRDAAQSPAVAALGAQPIVADVERGADLGPALDGADAAIFAAGSGPRFGRKLAVDRDGATAFMAAARRKGVARFLMVSAMDAVDPPTEADRLRLGLAWHAGELFRMSADPPPSERDAYIREKVEYVRAKVEADRALAASGLAFTIVKPGLLTDDPAAGSIAAAPADRPGRGLPIGRVSRHDVAAVLAACLANGRTVGRSLEIVGGTDAVPAALERAIRDGDDRES